MHTHLCPSTSKHIFTALALPQYTLFTAHSHHIWQHRTLATVSLNALPPHSHHTCPPTLSLHFCLTLATLVATLPPHCTLPPHYDTATLVLPHYRTLTRVSLYISHHSTRPHQILSPPGCPTPSSQSPKPSSCHLSLATLSPGTWGRMQSCFSSSTAPPRYFFAQRDLSLSLSLSLCVCVCVCVCVRVCSQSALEWTNGLNEAACLNPFTLSS